MAASRDISALIFEIESYVRVRYGLANKRSLQRLFVSIVVLSLHRVAGVKTVWVASPRPHRFVIAAAYIAGADGLLAVGGAQVSMVLMVARSVMIFPPLHTLLVAMHSLCFYVSMSPFLY